ncbi:alpha/beta hydrolase-fold protein, partial [Sandarakinorhabdus sp.]|uniref:alpha/beta hydrolase-fold protein n=1 Tax=Sandarakinorhabdus sp. TaxID=1916663 RepID=UPI003340FE90
METLSRAACHGGVQSFHSHASTACRTAMRFGVFVPPGAKDNGGPFPVLWCLAGLTCNEETFATKAGAQRLAAALGLMLVTPDTSPRGADVADDPAWDMGQAASFYVDATQAPWAAHFQMRTWLIDELPGVIAAHFPADLARQGITGHSMGGHGALTLALKHPGRFKSVSAFAPIAAPMQ